MTLSSQLTAGLRDIVGPEQVLTEPGDCWAYGYDNSRRHAPPDAVVFPDTHEHVRDIVRLCNEFRTAIITRGRGTGTTGATVPLGGGLVISTERMNRILKMDPANRYIRVEPGVTNQQVQEAAGAHGFFWPPDPTSAAYCSVGGNLAYNSAGPRAVKYGTPRENVLGLRAVTGSGSEIKTGVLTSKGVVGYDLTRLLIGSEGTLAIITEATLKLTPLPQTRRTLRAVYTTVGQAAQAVSRIMAQPVVPCALEFIDHAAIAMVRDYAAVDLPREAGAMLMIEVDGMTDTIDHSVEAVRGAAEGSGLTEFRAAATAAETADLWAVRKALSPALRNVAPKKINEDVVVPVSEIPTLVDGLGALATRHQIKIVNFGHAGNGNIHVNLLFDHTDSDASARAQACLDEVFDLVLSLGGTLSGEHGIGLEKRNFVKREIDAVTLDLMHRLRLQFDPLSLLNPGKALPEGSKT